MPTCPQCGADVSLDADRCAVCGAELPAPEPWECPGCEAAVPGDADACPRCGHLRVPAACARHPDRSARGACVVCGRPLCDECDRGTSKVFLCQAHEGVDIIEGWAEVYSTGDDTEAELVRDALLGEGIDAQVFSQKDHFSFTVDLGDLARVRVLVPAYEYEDAMRDLAERQSDTGAVARPSCPSCGADYEPGDTTCAACGAALVDEADA